MIAALLQAHTTMKPPQDISATIARFQEGPSLLEATVSDLADDVLDFVPAGGGWTTRQIVHHVIDGDDIWKLGIKMAIGADQSEFDLGWYRAMPQQAWSERWAYGSRSLDSSLTLLSAIRAHVLQLLENVPEAWNREVLVRNRDGKIERIPVGFVIQMQADHLYHHVRRIRVILEEVRSA